MVIKEARYSGQRMLHSAGLVLLFSQSISEMSACNWRVVQVSRSKSATQERFAVGCCGRLEGSCRKKKEILPEARSEWHVVTLDSHSCPTPQYSCSQVPRGPHWPHPLNLNRISLQCLWRFVKRHGYKAISTLLKRCHASLRKVWSSLARGWYANNNCVEDPVGQSCSIVLRFQCFNHVKHL